MSYQDQPGGYPPPPREGESQYPPPPGEEDDRRSYQHQRAPSGSNVTLPSISPYEYQHQQQPNGYPPDPRYAPDPYRQPPPPPPAGQYQENRPYDYSRAPQQPMNFQQSAPRQRTAIACRYCRRRKIRCSGFDQSPEGRCINCQRFQQECIFTPVSSQAQAFVPAHAVYPGMRNMGVGPDGRPRPVGYPEGTQLYGAHGQPLGPIPPQAHAPPYGHYGHASASPTTAAPSYSPYAGDRPEAQESRKRPAEEPHPSILPPPVPGQAGYARSEGSRRAAADGGDLRLPPVTPTTGPQSNSNHSPGGSSTSSHSALQPPQASSSGLPSRTPPPRTSPTGDSRSDPMSLGSIMERRPDTEIDRSMLGRLGRRGQ